jgi:2-(3-amino-3-carboxypropyl)histidine synthase
MEEDRAATNLGPDIEEEILEEPVEVPKQPKRRFVGRKTTAKDTNEPKDPNATIEDTSAIQGVRNRFEIQQV